ncbi:MAG TPA: HEAT repeat domain-containing protein [Planctomycetaceae bacterium]|jgi:hypothetical protein
MDDSYLNYVDPRQNDPRSVSELISAALGDPHTYEDGGWDAVVALHWRGTEEALVRAGQLCQSFCAVERRVGADIIGQLGFSDGNFKRQRLNILLKMLRRERDSEVLYSVFIALGHVGEADAISPAARFRTHPDPSVRYAVVHALTGYDNPVALDSLMELTNDEDSDVRDWATWGLGTQVEVDTPALRDALAGRLADADEVVRSEALIGLARRKDERVLAALLKELAADSVDFGVVEAAELLADPHLHSALIAVRGRLEGHEELLKRAILACTPDSDQV